MAKVVLTAHLAAYASKTEFSVDANDVRNSLERIFDGEPGLRSYVLDDQGRPRKHVAILVNGQPIKDRDQLSDQVTDSDSIFILQALSGG
jgi:sulfur-carrier protein